MPQEIDKFVAPRYRSAGRRPEAQQDRRAAADAPLALLRGMLSGVAGAPGDLESFVRMLPGLSEKTILPTSEDVERAMPLRAASDTPLGRAATGIGQIGGGFYTGPGSPLRAVAALPSAVRKAGRDFAVASGQPTSNVIKQKGGNWLAGSVEDALKGLRAQEEYGGALPARIQEFNYTPAEAEAVYARGAPQRALNNWIDKQLTRYVKNEMATPEDPVRALAERGVLHVGPGGLMGSARTVHPSGEVIQKLGKSDEALGWENASDRWIAPEQARLFLSTKNASGSPTVERNPWLAKVPPETPVYDLYEPSRPSDLGFTHLMDELRNATNPNSGLPRELLLKYDKLDKVSVPQAVERVSKINDWRAAQKAEADMARANNAAAVLHKDYPDKGFRWVELKKPEDTGRVRESKVHPSDEAEWHEEVLPPDDDLGADDLRGYLARDAARSEDESVSMLRDALKYEGETMGHCVGGYCPDVLEGRSRIFSLRDAKGQPHTTIEVKPGGKLADARFGAGVDFDGQAIDDIRRTHPNLDDESDEFMELAHNRAEELAAHWNEKQPPPELSLSRIVQIKGKSNRAPNPEYLPYVQDFVKSGQWSDVGDLGNTGLITIEKSAIPWPKGVTSEQIDALVGGMEGGTKTPRFARGEFTKKAQQDLGTGYVTEQEYSDWLAKQLDQPGYATGGIVQGAYDPSRIDALAAELAKELAL